MDETKAEIIKSLAQGDLKAVLGALLVKCMDRKQFVDMFVDAGDHDALWRRELLRGGLQFLSGAGEAGTSVAARNCVEIL